MHLLCRPPLKSRPLGLWLSTTQGPQLVLFGPGRPLGRGAVDGKSDLVETLSPPVPSYSPALSPVKHSWVRDLKGHLIGGWNKSMYTVLDFFFSL